MSKVKPSLHFPLYSTSSSLPSPPKRNLLLYLPVLRFFSPPHTHTRNTLLLHSPVLGVFSDAVVNHREEALQLLPALEQIPSHHQEIFFSSSTTTTTTITKDATGKLLERAPATRLVVLIRLPPFLQLHIGWKMERENGMEEKGEIGDG